MCEGGLSGCACVSLSMSEVGTSVWRSCCSRCDWKATALRVYWCCLSQTDLVDHLFSIILKNWDSKTGQRGAANISAPSGLWTLSWGTYIYNVLVNPSGYILHVVQNIPAVRLEIPHPIKFSQHNLPFLDTKVFRFTTVDLHTWKPKHFSCLFFY